MAELAERGLRRDLITRPKLLVLDESVSALDVSAQQAILGLLRALQDSFGLAHLFITTTSRSPGSSPTGC